jgi:GPI mannosyltransferase 2
VDLGVVDDSSSSASECLRRFAVSQSLLAVMALLSYHVQIITRLSSGYPLWYIWLLSSIKVAKGKSRTYRYFTKPSIIIRWMVVYAVVQGALFASFLPPA